MTHWPNRFRCPLCRPVWRLGQDFESIHGERRELRRHCLMRNLESLGCRAESRRGLLQLPTGCFFEVPGWPSIVYQLRDYSCKHGGFGSPKHGSHRSEGARQCREDLPFLFKAFEAGNAPPPAPGTKEAEGPRASTIHEYLDWTVSAAEAQAEDELVGCHTLPQSSRGRPSDITRGRRCMDC